MMKPTILAALLALTLGCGKSTVEITTGTDTGVTPDAQSATDAASSGPMDTGSMPPRDMSFPDTTQADFGATDQGSIDMTPDVGPAGSPGCQGGAAIPEGENLFMLEDRERRFIMRLPTGYTADRPWPLVFALHGNGGSAAYWDGTSGDRNIRGVLQDNAILIIAEAIEGNWRDYNADQATWPARIESELAYFDELITRSRDELCIDEDAIFSMGFSGGGSFSGVLGCRRTDIRGIAVGGSVIYFDEANCIGTPAAWVTIGELELSGGRTAYKDFFRDRAGCDATSTDAAPSPCVAYDNCDSGTPVHYCEHPGDHIWPNFGSQAMWDFFSALR